MNFKVILGATLLSLAVPASVGIAQTAGIPTPAETDALSASQTTNSLENQAGKTAQAGDQKKLTENLFSVGVAEQLELEKGKAIETPLVFRSQPKVDEPVSIEGVTIDGYSSYATYNGKVIGQTVITSLKKDGMIVDLDAQDFSSQYNMDTPKIEPEQEISIKGNEAALVRALKTLNGEDAGEEKEEEEEEKEEVQEKSDGGSSAINSSGANDDATNGYQTPERRNVADPAEEIKITEEGCQPVYDSVQNVVKGQNKTQTFKDGVLVSETACEPSGVTYTVQKQYGTCPDIVDVPGRSAQPQFQAYYLDDVKVRKDLGECQPDLNQTFEITEKDNCPINVDLIARTATVASSLVYTDRNNTERTARACEPSQTLDPLPLVLNTQVCSLKHDFGAGRSDEMGTWTYTKGGVTYQASDCINTGNVFPHNKVFKENGVDVCPVLINMDTKAAIPQSRTQITVAGSKKFIDECKPDQSASKDIRATTDTCSNPATFKHDLSAGVSYGMERFYYDNPGRVYVTECLQGETSYNHDVEITSWKYDDEQLKAQPLSTVSITVDGTKYTIVSDILLGGAREIAYAALEDETVENTAARYYEACNSFVPTSIRKVYERPDGTKHYVAAGEGAPIAEGDKCVREVETVERWFKTTTTTSPWTSSASMENVNGVRVTVPTGYGTRVFESDGPYSAPQVKRKNNEALCSDGQLTITNYTETAQRTRITEPGGEVSYTQWVRLREQTKKIRGYDFDPRPEC